LKSIGNKASPFIKLFITEILLCGHFFIVPSSRTNGNTDVLICPNLHRNCKLCYYLINSVFQLPPQNGSISGIISPRHPEYSNIGYILGLWPTGQYRPVMRWGGGEGCSQSSGVEGFIHCRRSYMHSVLSATEQLALTPSGCLPSL